MNIRQTIKRLKSAGKSRDGKILLENFFSLSMLQVAGYVFPLITLPYLARVIGLDMFGEIAFAAAIVMYFQTILDWGFSYTATRDIAKNRTDFNKVSEIFCNVMSAKILLLLASTIIFAILIYTIPYLTERKTLMWLTYSLLLGYFLFPEFFFQGMEKMKYMTIMNVFAKLLFTILVFVVIRRKEDFIWQPMLISFGFLISGIISIVFIFRKFKIKVILPTFKSVWKTIKGSANMFWSLLLPNLYTNLSVILLSAFSGAGATGIYDSGRKFISIIDQLSQTLSRTFYPFLARRSEKHNLYVKISAVTSIVMSLILFLLADLLVKIFYTAEFTDAVTVVRIMAITPIFAFFYHSYGINKLVISGKEYVFAKINIVCSIIGCILGILGTYYFSYIGIALSVVLTRGIISITSFVKYRELKDKNYE
jgi:PST family polysaccharide transporter